MPADYSSDHTQPPAQGFTIFGIKTKLLLAFASLAALTALASGIAWYVFTDIDHSVIRITGHSIPRMMASLELAEKSAEIAATAPGLMASSDQAGRTLQQSTLEQRVKELFSVIDALERTSQSDVSALAEVESRIAAELRLLNDAVDRRLQLHERITKETDRLTHAHTEFLEGIEPLIDDAVFDLVISGEQVSADSAAATNELVEGGVNRIHRLLTINAEGNLAVGLLGEVSQVTDSTLIQPIRERFVAAVAAVDRNLRQLSDSTPGKQALLEAAEALLAPGNDNENLFDTREQLIRTGGVATLLKESEKSDYPLKRLHEAFLNTLLPMIDDATFDLVITTEQVTTQSMDAIEDLIGVGVDTLRVLLIIRAEGNLAAGLLNQAAGAQTVDLLQPLRERFTAAASRVERMLAQLPVTVTSHGAFRELVKEILSNGVGGDSIFELRREELQQIAGARASLDTNRALAVQLGDNVARVVEAARAASDSDAHRSASVIRRGKLLMILITVAGITGAAAIVLFYVTPRIIRPLEQITASMTELADGDTSVDIPGRDRTDEIGKIAQALGVFRDTAVEVQQTNLREIQETRRRLSDAIESISEGFSLYDAEDRLVVCNRKYLDLLYPDMVDEIEPGMRFDSIIRRAAEAGYIEDAKGRVEEWITKRLTHHHDPGEPHLQRRHDGRWILISEHRTKDGGTVAVYSDITDLKQREQELADKSGALEQLSSQLAKYLSPQVYDSIFTGRQEVKVASRRKKLTVFFSDIAGFTETADKLESEDLTDLLNHYLTEMSEIALAHGATIDKYIGDAIVIFFGDPESRGVQEDALACVTMAIAMRERMRELQQIWRAAGIENPLQCRIGINTGYCTVGNFGSETRMDYTIIGGGVNLASRLETAATPGEILISYETYAHIKDRVHCEEHGKISVKGIAYPIETYQVVDTHERLGRIQDQIREDQPNLKMYVDVEAMSESERRDAVQTLRHALDRLIEPLPAEDKLNSGEDNTA